MRKIALMGLAGLGVMAVAGVVVFRGIAAMESSGKASSEVSLRAAKSLQLKIDTIKEAENDPKHRPGSSEVDLFESELESYLLYSLKDDVPAQIDTADVQLGQDTVGLDTQITFSSSATGNAVTDALLGGTHDLSLRGKFIARSGRGKFDLQEVRVDGIPVPNVLIQSLIKKYVKPKYPEVDLNEPFDMPWGIKELKVEGGKAKVIY